MSRGERVRIWYENGLNPIVVVDDEGERTLVNHVAIHGPSEVVHNPEPGPGERRVYVVTTAPISTEVNDG